MLLRFAILVAILVVAVSCLAGSGLPVGSITSPGTARISGITVPSGAVVFSGDVIEAGPTHAIFTLSDGNFVTLGSNASVRVSKAENVPAVELLRGMSRVQMHSKAVRLVASNWTLEANPDARTGRAMADVLRDADGTVSVNVKEGELVARSTGGKTVLRAAVGRPVLLPAAAAPPPAAPPKPQKSAGSGGSGTSPALVGAYIIGAAAIAAGVAAIASDDTNDEEARRAAAAANARAEQAARDAAAAARDAAAAAAQVTALQNIVAALQRTVTSLQLQLTQQTQFSQQQQALIVQLADLVTRLNRAQSELNGIAARILAGTATAEDRDRLNVLASQISGIVGELAGVSDRLAQTRPPGSPSNP